MSVKETIRLAKSLDKGQMLDLKKDTILSSNIVTGYSVNLPIYKTCQPSKLCATNCYAAITNKPIAMKASQNKQIKLLNSIKSDPYSVADKIVKELRAKQKKGLKFIRWNGVGDLFEEAIECLVSAADQMPELPFWVVTRIPKYAAIVPHRENIFVHFSLDSTSLDRFEKVCGLSPLSQNLFFSYTADKGEIEASERLKQIPISVFFSDLYGQLPPKEYEHVSCPLNGSKNISSMCESCGRCWSKDALSLKQGETVPVYKQDQPAPAQPRLL